MVERLFFSKLVTKDLTAIDSNRRLFEGVLTVEMKDRQGEITVRDELMKVLPIWIARGGPITDTHSNRVVGQGINYQSTTVTDSDGVSYPAITIQGEIFKDYELDNEIWESIVSGKYKGLSFGGATKSSRVPILQKDGSIAYSLKDLEQYEVAVCEEPAVPLALITQHNALAKAMAGKTVDRGNGQMCIRCDKFKCYIDKADDPIKSFDSKSGDEFSDVSDKNKPYEDEQAEALENNRGEPQENGATYHGTDKGILTAVASKIPGLSGAVEAADTSEDVDKARHSMDDAVYARSERVGVDEEPATDKLKDGKAIDEDNKDALEEAGLEEEKKLEYANDESEGPSRPTNKIVGVIAGAALRAVATAGRAGASGASTAARAGMSGGDTCGGECETTCKALGETDNPGAPKYTATNEEGDKTDKYGNKIPGVMSKKPKQDDDKPQGRLTSPVKVRTGQTVAESRTERGEKPPGMTDSVLAQRQSRMSPKKKPTHNAPYGIPSVRHGDAKKALDILNLTFELKISGGKLPGGKGDYHSVNGTDYGKEGNKVGRIVTGDDGVGGSMSSRQTSATLSRERSNESMDDYCAVEAHPDAHKLGDATAKKALDLLNLTFGLKAGVSPVAINIEDQSKQKPGSYAKEDEQDATDSGKIPQSKVGGNTLSDRMTAPNTYDPNIASKLKSLDNMLKDAKTDPLTPESRRAALQKPGGKGPKGMDPTKIPSKLVQDADYIREGMKIYPEGDDAKVSTAEAELGKAIALVKLNVAGMEIKPVQPTGNTAKPTSGTKYMGDHGKKFGSKEEMEAAAGEKTTMNKPTKHREAKDPNAMTIGDRIAEKGMVPHLIDSEGYTWYLCDGHVVKAETTNEWTGEAGGGNWGREPGKTRDDESKSPQAAIQPKHVGETTNEPGAKGLKKENPLQHGKLESQGRLTGSQQNQLNHKRETLGVLTGKIPGKKVGRRNTSDMTTMDEEIGHQTEYDPDIASKLKADPRDHPSFSNTAGGYKTRENGYGPKGNEEFDKKDPRHITELGAKFGDMASGLKTPNTMSRSGSCESNAAKAAGDPQLQANNSEDGVNRKIRLDNDKEAEAFTNKDDKWDRSERENERIADSPPEQHGTRAKLPPVETSQIKVKPGNDLEQHMGNSKQQPGKHAITDEVNAARDRKVPHPKVGTKEPGYNAQHSIQYDPNLAENLKSTPVDGGSGGAGGVRSGAAYDNSQNGIGTKDDARKVEDAKYTGGVDTSNGGDNEKFNKATIIMNMLNFDLKKTFI